MFDGNIYIKDLVTATRHYKENLHVLKLTKEASSIDSLRDFESFRSLVIKIKESELKSGGTFGTNRLASESCFYGHLKALIEYAGFDYQDRFRLIFPNIEHGIGWLQRIPNNVSRPYVHCAIAQGGYRKKAICARRPGMPFYSVGPYVHYAEQYYSSTEIKRLKRQLGKTLLIFPAHTYELSNVSYAKEQFVENVMQKWAASFDSVLISAYWHDVDDSVFTMFMNAGAHVVSSGLREDPYFISRLKTLITLSDAVAGNALGTHIGYCECLNKPFYMIDDDAAVVADAGNAFKTDEEMQLDEVFDAACRLYKADGDKGLQTEFYRKYWGGTEAIKTPEEIRCMIMISEEVLKRSQGSTSKFQSIVNSLMIESERGNSNEDKMRFRLLSDALGCD